MNSPLALPFDQYQRYRLVSDLLAALRPEGRSLRVLDVGGRTAVLRRFLDDPVTLVDVEPSDEPGLVLGDGARLPFQDRSFDVVTAFDTLEHVPPPLREAFVAECRRVARSYVVLAGPYEAPRVVEAERLLQRFLREKLGVEHRYLEEHRSNGLPRREAVQAQLQGLGGEIAAIGHGNLDRWLALMCVALYLDDDAALRPLAEAVHTFYNRSLYASDHANPVYRHAVVAAFEGAPLPDASALLDPPVAPRGALEPFTELTVELLAFDRERGAWRTERDRLRKAVDDLRKDLEGHQSSLEEMQEDLEARKRLNAELEATLADERVQAAGVRSELEAACEASLEVARKLEVDLRRVEGDARKIQEDLLAANTSADGLGRTVEERGIRIEALERAHEEARVELQAAQAASAALRSESKAARDEGERLRVELARSVADVDGLELEKSALRKHLEALQREAAALRGEREALIAEVQALRATLRRRWDNLKRALGPRRPQ